MFNALKPASQLVRSDRFPLPPALHGNALVLEFAQPIPGERISEFFRVQLDWKQLSRGEERFYLTNVVQPSLVCPDVCPTCGMSLRRLTTSEWACCNPKCRHVGKSIHGGPSRGVVNVIVCDDMVTTTVDGTSGVIACVLLLDRRYDDECLLSIKQQCGNLCDMLGWKLL